MKRKTIKILGILVLCMCMFSCREDTLTDTPEAAPDEKTESGNSELTIVAARQWYEANQPPVVKVRFNRESKGVARLVKPGWEDAKESHRGRFEVVETPLMTRGSHLIVDAETQMHFDPENADPAIRNTARMVVLKDLVTGDIRSFIMVFVGSYSYLKNTENIGRNTYLYREPDYEGDVLFFEPNGEFINGWAYKNGKIVAKIKSGYGANNN